MAEADVDADEECEEVNEADLSLAILFLLLTLMFAVLIARYTHARKLFWLQSSSTSLVLGILIGGVAWLTSATVFKDANVPFNEFVAFEPEFFFIVLVPPIIFNAGFTLEGRSFFANAGAFCTYAFIGTIISMFVIWAALLLVTLILGSGMTSLSSVLFGSLISATDPVTVLAIFTQLKVDHHLYTLVFGESVMNDAVAIVLYKTILRFEPTKCKPDADHITGGAIFSAIGFFFIIFIGSTVMGCVVGLGSALLHKRGWFRNFGETEVGIMEASLVILPPYVAYMAAEALQLSGIVSILFCGIIMSHYTKWNLSDDSRHIVEAFFEIVAYIAETFIFIYIGTTVFLSEHRYKDIPFTLLTLIVVLLSRALNIYPLTFLINRWRPVQDRVPMNQQHMMFFSGLRGGIAFALAIEAKQQLENKKDGMLIFDCTLAIVLFTVWINGGLTPTMLNYYKIKFGDDGGKDTIELSALGDANVRTPLNTDGYHDDDDDDGSGFTTNTKKRVKVRGHIIDVASGGKDGASSDGLDRSLSASLTGRGHGSDDTPPAMQQEYSGSPKRTVSIPKELSDVSFLMDRILLGPDIDRDEIRRRSSGGSHGHGESGSLKRSNSGTSIDRISDGGRSTGDTHNTNSNNTNSNYSQKDSDEDSDS